jgi:hypothetical protein
MTLIFGEAVQKSARRFQFQYSLNRSKDLKGIAMTQKDRPFESSDLPFALAFPQSH